MPVLAPNPIDTAIGARIRQARRAKKVAPKVLAAALGVQRNSVEDYEGGRRRISASALYQVARRLDVPVSYFYADMDGAAGHG